MAGEIIAFFFEVLFETCGEAVFSKKVNRKLRWAIFLIILIGGISLFSWISIMLFAIKINQWAIVLGIIMVMFTVGFAVSYTKSFLKSVKEEKVI